MSEKTIFQKIIDREIPAPLVYEDDLVAAFNDINPQAPIHVLIVPKKLIPRVGEVSVILGAVIGAGLGFLWFNAPPAQIFMGDTGSLALGGLLGSVAVATKHEIVFAIVGGLFVLEAMSVIIQVASFKLTGKRVFRMAPIHHHFEKKGWQEPQVVIRFWIIAVILALIGLATLKLR